MVEITHCGGLVHAFQLDWGREGAVCFGSDVCYSCELAGIITLVTVAAAAVEATEAVSASSGLAVDV